MLSGRRSRSSTASASRRSPATSPSTGSAARRARWPGSTSSSTAPPRSRSSRRSTRSSSSTAAGPARLLRALRADGSDPYFVHVSTAYAAGRRTGLVLERPSGAAPAEPPLDLEAELEAARAWRRDLEAESRLQQHQKRFVEEAKRAVGPAGGPAVGGRAEALRREWVPDQLTERSRERSRALGWSDAYGLSKALGERLLLEERPRRLTIVRPSIIESALRTPYPGWLEDLKVADPIILAYAAGMIPRFPGNPSAQLDLVPVDLVANACVAAAAHPPDGSPGRSRSSRARATRSPSSRPPASSPATSASARSPGRTGCRSTSRTGASRRTRASPGARPHGDAARRRPARRRPRPAPARRRARAATAQGAAPPGPAAPAVGDLRPYVEIDCSFDDRSTRELLAGLAPADRERFDFDVEGIDWEAYLRDVHLPALRAIVAPPRPPRRRARSERRPRLEGPPALAFFDVEGVVLDTTIAHFYAWLRTRDMPELDRLVWSAGLAARVPGWLQADRRSRAAFNRRFYRLYRDLPARELRAQAAEALPDFIQPRMQHEAVRRIRAHRRHGDRVVLMTGALDFLVDSLRHLGDELSPRGWSSGRALHRRAGRAAADGRRARLAGRAPRRRARARPRRLPRLRRQHRRPAAARARRPPARRQPGLPPGPRGAPARLAGRGVDDRAGRGLMLALRYTPSLPRYLAARAGVPNSGALALEDVRPPSLPSPDWLPVRPRLSGICGSDHALLAGKASLYLASLTSGPFVPGHEVVGEITGGPRRGERVVLQPALGCVARGIEPRCPECARGLPALCRHTIDGRLSAGLQTGYCRDAGGGWSEGLVAHASQLYPVPDDLADEDAVFVEPLACALHAAAVADPEPGENVAVIGAGTIGLLTVAALRERAPAATIVCAAKHSGQAAAARRLGADDTCAPGELHARRRPAHRRAPAGRPRRPRAAARRL